MNTCIGQVFGAYRLTTLLGRGAYTEVYLGEHTRIQRQAVLKLLTLPLPPWGWTAFQQTCTQSSKLVHPGIVPLLDFDQQDGTVFLVQEYLPTGSLGHHYAPGTRVPLQQVADWVQWVAEALSYAHSRQVLHLGLKPSNLLLVEQQEVMVSDFGLAAFARPLLSTQLSMTVESVAYLAPEQLQGQAGPASDQYALAVCAYQWLRGALPFQGETSAIIAGHLASPPPPLRPDLPELPAEVEQVLLTALRKQPTERFSSMQAFAHAFTQASRRANNTPGFMPIMPASSSAPEGQASPTLLSPAQPASATLPAPAPGSLAPGVALPPFPASPPQNWLQAPSGLGQRTLSPYPQPSQPAAAGPRVSRRTVIAGGWGLEQQGC
ncbi:MAG TPA: protein kinase [Ktedonobacteraceae bacterium]